ncbi:hypothetical protein [Natrarchaeobaculum sulfurireducens]|uniref:hypothetical protein n=1 Tax=Natrarchaeobaculum sulfurireducens TaxID=2044521 RepID=UPI000E3D5B12|nr:hypothetical protein [Natrarchaeobaculum sulfurireducens]
MTAPESSADPYRSPQPRSTGRDRLRHRLNLVTCLIAFGLTLPVGYGLYSEAVALTQSFGGLSTTALVIIWAAAWLLLWATFQSIVEWNVGTTSSTARND